VKRGPAEQVSREKKKKVRKLTMTWDKLRKEVDRRSTQIVHPFKRQPGNSPEDPQKKEDVVGFYGNGNARDKKDQRFHPWKKEKALRYAVRGIKNHQRGLDD